MRDGEGQRTGLPPFNAIDQPESALQRLNRVLIAADDGDPQAVEELKRLQVAVRVNPVLSRRVSEALAALEASTDA